MDYDIWNPTDMPEALWLMKIRGIAREKGILHVMFEHLQPKERNVLYSEIEKANPSNDSVPTYETPRENPEAS